MDTLFPALSDHELHVNTDKIIATPALPLGRHINNAAYALFECVRRGFYESAMGIIWAHGKPLRDVILGAERFPASTTAIHDLRQRDGVDKIHVLHVLAMRKWPHHEDSIITCRDITRWALGTLATTFEQNPRARLPLVGEAHKIALRENNELFLTELWTFGDQRRPMAAAVRPKTNGDTPPGKDAPKPP
jgi:hypothetical protein